jgi:hypothetical protein
MSASITNGKASPSFRPASAVRAKRASSSGSRSIGPPTWTSSASTGSVGARTAPSRMAPAAVIPISHVPSSATPMMVSGIATASSRIGVRQPRQVSARSSFTPAPNRETMTASSAARLNSAASSIGSYQAKPMARRSSPMVTPAAR